MSDFDSALINTRINELRSAIKDNAITPEQKLDTLLRTQEITLMLILDDHTKTVSMWAVFRPLAWAMTIALAGIIGLAIAGHITIAIIP